MTASPTLILPSAPALKQGWRAAYLAYRASRQTGAGDAVAHHAAVKALQTVLPELPAPAAAEQARSAIYFASNEHPAWFWHGVGKHQP